MTIVVPAPERLEPTALLEWLQQLREGGAARWQGLADLAGLPLAEVVASPFGLRAIALGVREGARTVHRELRAPIDFADDPRTADPMHGVWDRGQLHIGKYQAFLQDAPHVTYDPAHHAKWAPHEFLHRAASFLRTGDDFEDYLGARLNELLPVAVWWGHDEFCRLDGEGEGYDRAAGVRAPQVGEARWLSESADALRARVEATLPLLLAGQAHVRAERDAIDEERRSRQRVVLRHRVRHAVLDASSDALAYVVAHRARWGTTDAAVREHGFTELEAYVEHVDGVHRALLHEGITLDPAECEAKRRARDGWDVALRRALLEARHEPDDAAELAEANGHLGYDLDLLGAGVESFAPVTLARLDHFEPTWIEDFAESAALWRRAPLPARFAAWLAQREGREVEVALLRFERAIADARPDDRADELESDGKRVVQSRAYTRIEATFDLAALHAGETDEARPGRFAWWIGATQGEVHVIPESEAIAKALARVAEGPAPLAAALAIAGPDADVLLAHRVLLRTR